MSDQRPLAAVATDIPGPGGRNVISPPPPVAQPPAPPERTWGPELAKALAAAQAAAKTVAKKAFNTHHKYNYASADSIIDEASEALSGFGLSVFPVDTGPMPGWEHHVWIGEGEAAVIDRPRRILCRYELLHESGQFKLFQSSAPVLPEKGRPEDKAEFGARTEALGYAMRDLLLIPREAAADVNTPSARDDTGPPAPRGQGNGNGSKKAPAPAAQPANQNAPRPGTAERAQRINLLLTAPKNEQDPGAGGLGMPKPAAFDWLKARFGKGQANLLYEPQQADAEILLMAKMEGDKVYREKVAEFAKAGRCLGDGEVSA